MREEGMSNRAIGEALGISRVTVHKYLGPQGPGIRREYGAARNPKPYKDPAPVPAPVEEAPACLVVEDRIVALQGMAGSYDISPKRQLIDVTLATGEKIQVGFEVFRMLVDEMSAIKRKLDSLKIENEMW